MKKYNFSLELQKTIPTPDWSWLLLALRQDALIWSSLQVPDVSVGIFNRLQQTTHQWNIAALALLPDETGEVVGRLSLDPMTPIPETLIFGVEHARKLWDNQPNSLKTLKQAAEIAISFRQEYLEEKNWDFLPKELQKNPGFSKTILACLFGILPQPLEPMVKLISMESSEQEIELVVHALLCQPISVADQKSIFQSLVDKLPMGLGVQVLTCLQRQRPWLVADLANGLLSRSEFEPSLMSTDPLVLEFKELSKLVDLAAINQYSAQPARSITFLIDALKNARKIQGHLSARLAQSVLIAKQDGKAEKQETDLEAWKQAVRLAPDEPDYSSGLVRSLVNEGRLADAQLHLGAWQSKDRYSEHAELLMVSSQVASGLGDKENAFKLAQRALVQVQNGNGLDVPGYLALRDIFNQNDQLDLTDKVLKAGLERFPTNTELLSSLANTLKSLKKPDECLDNVIAYMAVHTVSSPELNAVQFPLFMRLLYVDGLEALGEWNFALAERLDLLASSNRPGKKELYEASQCAIKADQPQKALELCLPILDENAEDDIALGLCGEAYTQSRDFITSIDYFRKAVRLAPSRAELWLQLAQACKLAGMDAQRLDVLKAASQALPDDAEIQLVLGEAYLSRNAPTQALIYLRRAASLETKPRIMLRLGQTLLQLGHLEEARTILENAYLAEKENWSSLDNAQDSDLLGLELMHAYGRSLLSTGDRENAIPLLARVVELQPEVPTPYMDLGRAILYGQPTPQQAQQAIAYLQKAISLITENTPEMVKRMSIGDTVTMEAEALSLLAEAYAASGELQQSHAVYRQVLDDQVAQKSGWRARLAMGFSRVAIKLDQPETALAVLKEALQKEPQNIALLQALADAYLENGLAQDAYDIASKVIEQQPVEIDTVNWFVIFGSQLRKHPGTVQTLVQSDMIRLLHNAVRTAPARVDLMVQLGKLLLEKGERQPAVDVFRKLSEMEVKDWQIDAIDLYQAGKTIREWGDAALSVFLLEKAIEKVSFGQEKLFAQSAVQVADMYKELSVSHQKAENHTEALKAVDQAIRLRPDQPKFYLHKADLYSEMRKPQEMLDCLKPAIKLSPEDPKVNHRVAQALYINGDLPGALKHAEQALSKKDSVTDENSDLATRYLAAEISRAMLKPRQAIAYLPDKLAASGEADQKMEQTSLQAELALEVGDLNLAEAAAVEMRKIDAEDPRGLAVQARLASLHGDDETARRLLQTANQVLERQIVQRTGRNGKPSNYLKPDRERAVCRSAAWLRQWELAYVWACKGVECAPHEPISHLLKAQVIIERAEEQALCNDLQVVVHAPGEDVLGEKARLEFEEAVKEAERTIKQFAASPGDESNQALNIWKARGNSVFLPDYQNAVSLEEAVLSFPPTSSEVAAMLMAYRRIDQPAKAIKAVRDEFIHTYGGKEITEHPLVLTQLSIAYGKVDVQKALDTAALASQRAEISKVDQGAKRWPDVPMTYYLQAVLALQAGLLATAMQAIQKALADWPEEPRWHALAAQIYLGSDVQKGLPNLQKAKTHLELASRLEPLYAPHFVQLGRLYYEWGDYAQAVVALEQAGKLSPDNSDIWLLLAEVHQAAGDLDKAALNAERAMDNLDDKSQALILSGEIALKAKNPRSALTRAQSVLNSKPEHLQALHLMVHSLEALQRPDEALKLLDKTLPKLKDPVPTHMEKLMLLYRTKGLEAGLEALQDLVEQNIQSPELLALLAEWLSEADQVDAAVQTARAALQADHGRLSPSQQARLYRLIGLKMKQIGQLDQSIHALSQAVQLEPDQVEHYLNLAHAYQDRREHTQALKILEQANALFPDDYRPYYLSGIVFKDNKEYIEAEKMLRLAAKMAPGEVSIHRLLGAVVALNLVHNR